MGVWDWCPGCIPTSVQIHRISDQDKAGRALDRRREPQQMREELCEFQFSWLLHLWSIMAHHLSSVHKSIKEDKLNLLLVIRTKNYLNNASGSKQSCTYYIDQNLCAVSCWKLTHKLLNRSRLTGDHFDYETRAEMVYLVWVSVNGFIITQVISRQAARLICWSISLLLNILSLC